MLIEKRKSSVRIRAEPLPGKHIVNESKPSAEEQRKRNREFLLTALDEFKADVLSTLDQNPAGFFNATLELTTQNGIIKTAKPGIQKCRHATAVA